MESSGRPAAASAYSTRRRFSPLWLLAAVFVVFWIAYSAITQDYETELRDYLKASQTMTDDQIEKLVPLTFQAKQKATREKEESLSNRLERLEKSVDEIRLKLFGDNGTTAIPKVEKK